MRRDVTQGHHAGEEVVHGTCENASEDYPEQGCGAVQRADNRTEYRAESRDVQELNEDEFPGGHGHIVHAVSFGHDWRGTAAVNTKDFFGDDTVDCVTRYKQAQAAEKVSDTGHNKKALFMKRKTVPLPEMRRIRISRKEIHSIARYNGQYTICA